MDAMNAYHDLHRCSGGRARSQTHAMIMGFQKHTEMLVSPFPGFAAEIALISNLEKLPTRAILTIIITLLLIVIRIKLNGIV